MRSHESVIGWTGNPVEAQLRRWLEAMPRLAPLARAVMQAIRGGAPRSEGWASPMLQGGISQVMQGGMSPEEEISAKREIGDVYRGAVGAGGFAGGAGGAFSPRAVRRFAGREASQRLAPAMADLMAKKAQLRRQGMETGLGALSTVYGTQAQQGQREEEDYGKLLGSLLGGSALDMSLDEPQRRRYI